MRISFGYRPGGGLGGLPDFEIFDWNLVSGSVERLVFLPGAMTFMRRLGITLICAFFGFAAWTALPPADTGSANLTASERAHRERLLADVEQGAREAGVSQAEIDAIKLRNAREVAGMRAELSAGRSLRGQVRYGVAGFFGLIGLIAPLSCLWNRLVISITPRNELAVTTWGIFPRTQTFSFDLFATLQYGCEEYVHRTRHGGIGEHYWQWFVRMQARENTAGVTFHPLRQKDRPGAQPRPPKRVQDLVQWLHRHSRLPISGPVVIEANFESAGWQGKVIRKQVVPEVRLDSGGLPPGIVEALQSASPEEAMILLREPGVYHAVRHEIHYTDENGNMRYAGSLEELPPHVRARVEEQMRTATPEVHTRRSETFTIRDPAGNSRTFHSADELPPELRALYERFKPR